MRQRKVFGTCSRAAIESGHTWIVDMDMWAHSASVRCPLGLTGSSSDKSCLADYEVADENAMMMLKLGFCRWQERDAEVQGLQQKLAQAEEAHKSELVDLQAAIQTSRTKLQDTKVAALLSPSRLRKVTALFCMHASNMCFLLFISQLHLLLHRE